MYDPNNLYIDWERRKQFGIEKKKQVSYIRLGAWNKPMTLKPQLTRILSLVNIEHIIQGNATKRLEEKYEIIGANTRLVSHMRISKSPPPRSRQRKRRRFSRKGTISPSEISHRHGTNDSKRTSDRCSKRLVCSSLSLFPSLSLERKRNRRETWHNLRATNRARSAKSGETYTYEGRPNLPIFKLDIFLHKAFGILRRYRACFPPPRAAAMNDRSGTYVPGGLVCVSPSLSFSLSLSLFLYCWQKRGIRKAGKRHVPSAFDRARCRREEATAHQETMHRVAHERSGGVSHADHRPCNSRESRPEPEATFTALICGRATPPARRTDPPLGRRCMYVCVRMHVPGVSGVSIGWRREPSVRPGRPPRHLATRTRYSFG